MAKRRLITVEEAILLNLLKYRRHFQADTVPIEMTQAGISRVIGVRRSHVSSSLDNAKQKGTLEEKTAHIKGEARRRKCYTLTEMGLAHATDLEREIQEAIVSAVLPDGKEFEGPMTELIESVGPSYTLSRLALLTFDGITKIPPQEAKDEMPVRSGDGVPDVKIFLGRENELAALDKFFEGEGRFLMLKGIPGIGKSALMAYAVKHFTAEPKTFWHNVTEWGTPRNTAGHMAAFLHSLGFSRLKRYLGAHEVPDLADLKDILLEVDKPVVFVFDDCQNSSSSMTALLKMLVSVSESSKTIKLALVGRRIPDIELKQRAGGKIIEMELVGLDMNSSLDLLRGRGMTSPGIENIASKSEGHPLYLTLAEETDSEVDGDNVSTLLAREIFVALSDSEKEILSSLSVFRMPVRGDAFVKDEEDFEALENLERRSIVLSSGGWTMHNLFRDFFYERQTRTDREARHESAAEYYNAYSSDIPGKIEEAHHLFMARDFESALLLLTTQGPDWLRHGNQDEILQLSSLLPDDYDNQEERYEALMLKASALDQIGEWEAARRCYETGRNIATSERDNERSARALRGLGAIYYRWGELDDALETFERALSETKSRVLKSEIQNGIGVVQWRLGQTQKARAAYDTDLKISEEAQDLQGQARALNNLGILDWEEGGFDTALEKYARALDFAQRISAKKLVAILYSNIADAYKSKGEVTEARRFYERCLELSEDLRFNWQTAEAYRGMADVVEADRDKYLKKALRIFDRLGAKEDAKAVRVMMK